MAGTCCNLATQPKFISGYDDTLDVRVFCLSTFSAFFVFLVFSSFLLTHTGRFGGTIWLGRGRSLAGHPSVAVAVDVYAPLTRSTLPLLRDLGALHFGPVFVWPGAPVQAAPGTRLPPDCTSRPFAHPHSAEDRRGFSRYNGSHRARR
jgi:hypothetical protein